MDAAINSNKHGPTPLILKSSRESLEKPKCGASYGETNSSPLCESITSLTDHDEQFFSLYNYYSGFHKNIFNNEKLISITSAERSLLRSDSP